MIFDVFIASHVEWKMRLRDCVASADVGAGTLEGAGDSDRCLLGGWLRGDGRKHEALPAFGVVETTHAAFHRAAARVVETCVAGRRLEAEALLAGEYARQSAALVSALVELGRDAGAAEPSATR